MAGDKTEVQTLTEAVKDLTNICHSLLIQNAQLIEILINQLDMAEDEDDIPRTLN